MSDYFLADDLSGALDAAAAFHVAGRVVTVALSTAGWQRGAGQIVGFTTETRNVPAESAAAAVAQAIAFGRAQGGRMLYKKIDSTLRGSVAAELAAVLEALPEVRVLFSPANPAVGRTVEGGVLLVNGVPVSETEFGRDPASPVNESVIRRLLGAAASPRVEIADARNEADLAAAVARMDATGETWVGVGSGALAKHVASRRRQPAPTPVLPASDLSGPVLLICGSAHPKNREQAAALRRVEEVPAFEFRLDDPKTTVAAAIAELRAGRSAAVVVEAARHRDSRHVVHAVAAAAAAIIDAVHAQRIFVTGGETAFALCRQLGVEALSFIAELESGLSLSTAETSRGQLRFAIKPGGFGDEQTWIRACSGLRRTP